MIGNICPSGSQIIVTKFSRMDAARCASFLGPARKCGIPECEIRSWGVCAPYDAGRVAEARDCGCARNLAQRIFGLGTWWSSVPGTSIVVGQSPHPPPQIHTYKPEVLCDEGEYGTAYHRDSCLEESVVDMMAWYQ